jgi:hypothetical protein
VGQNTPKTYIICLCLKLELKRNLNLNSNSNLNKNRKGKTKEKGKGKKRKEAQSLSGWLRPQSPLLLSSGPRLARPTRLRRSQGKKRMG